MIKIIRRAVFLTSVSSPNFDQSLRLAGVWQSVQFMARAAEIMPIVSMNSSTEIPFNAVTLLKTLSDNTSFSCCGVWAAANEKVSGHDIHAATRQRMIPLDSKFMVVSLLRVEHRFDHPVQMQDRSSISGNTAT